MISVAARVGTRLFGYSNRLVSENILRLEGQEPAHGSDDQCVWQLDATLSEIQKAESEAHKVLEKKKVLVMRLADDLLLKGELNKEETRAIVKGSSTKTSPS